MMRMSRKMEHVRHALKLGQRGLQGLQGLHDIRFVHNCLPETSVERISLDTKIGDLFMSSPIIINAMTGGSPETESINRELAIAARELGLAMAVGSQMSALKNEAVLPSYQIVRRMNPDGLIFANLGSEATLDQAQRAIEMIRADALQIHLNVIQELIMPEGDRDFRGMIERLETIIRNVPVPVIIKEVGFGISGESARKLREVGVSFVDVGGMGGTNFAKIENLRREIPLEWLNDWGIKTSVAMLEAMQHFPYGKVIASGGITNAMEICKALSLGAGAVGIAGAFLRILQTAGTPALIQSIQEMQLHLKLIMTALGADSIEQLWTVPLIITGETADWCHLRGIDLFSYARRRQ